MEDILRYLLSGLSYGMLLFLIASGLSLILGVMGILNLAHGSLYMIGAYVGLSLVQRFDAPWILALLGAAIAAAILGFLMERLLLRRLHRRYNQQVLLTLGLVYIFGNVALWLWGSFPLSGRPPAFLSGSVAIGRYDFPVYRLALLAFGIAVAAGLTWFQNRTRAGAIVRAGMDDRDMVMALGINYPLVASSVFVLGAFLAGLAGFIGAPMLGANWNMAFPVLLSAMIVVVIGGLGRIEGTLLGALLIGVFDTLGRIFFPEFAMFTIYAVFIAVLLLRPAGLLGRVAADGQSAEPPGPVAAAVSGPKLGWRDEIARWATFALPSAFFLLAPFFVGGHYLNMLTEICIFGIFALSLNVLFGQTGLFSLGHAAFFGLGAYLSGILMVQHGLTNFWLLALIVLPSVAAFAVLAGIVALRTRGVYFIFVTLAIGELMVSTALKWVNVTGGSNGLYGVPYPDLGFAASGRLSFYFLVLAMLALSAFVLYRLSRSPLGMALQGIRDNERRMQHLGYNTQACQLLAFLISGGFAGLAGALYASYSTTVVPSYLGAMMSTLVMLMVIIGGANRFYGPLLGAALITVLQFVIGSRLPARWDLILGGIFVAAVLWLPGGLVSLAARLPRMRRG